MKTLTKRDIKKGAILFNCKKTACIVTAVGKDHFLFVTRKAPKDHFGSWNEREKHIGYAVHKWRKM